MDVNFSTHNSIQPDYTVELKKNDFFVEAGQLNTKLGFVRKGVLRGFATEESGNENIIFFYKENDWISGNFVPNVPADQNIQALEDCIIEVGDLKTIIALINKDEHLLKLYNETLEKIHLSIQLRFTSFISYNALKRYQYFLSEFPGLINRIPNYYVANFLGITPTQLSRIRKKFVEK